MDHGGIITLLVLCGMYLAIHTRADTITGGKDYIMYPVNSL